MFFLLLHTLSFANPCFKDFQDHLDPNAKVIETKELLYVPTMSMYLAAGSNPINDDDWAGFWKFGYVSPEPKKLLFSAHDSCLYRTINAPENCSGADCFPEVIISGYSWIHFTNILDNRCIPSKTLCPIIRSEEGMVQELIVKKCHYLTIKDVVYEVQSPEGIRYAMHAYSGKAPDLSSLVLPEGWSAQKRNLKEPLVLKSKNNDCTFTLLKDHLEQIYHRIE